MKFKLTKDKKILNRIKELRLYRNIFLVTELLIIVDVIVVNNDCIVCAEDAFSVISFLAFYFSV